jgi:hypothetical protein
MKGSQFLQFIDPGYHIIVNEHRLDVAIDAMTTR